MICNETETHTSSSYEILRNVIHFREVVVSIVVHFEYPPGPGEKGKMDLGECLGTAFEPAEISPHRQAERGVSTDGMVERSGNGQGLLHVLGSKLPSVISCGGLAFGGVA